MDNIVMEKYVRGVNGAQTLFEAIGFKKIVVPSKDKEDQNIAITNSTSSSSSSTASLKNEFLYIDESQVKVEVFDFVIQIMNEYLNQVEKKPPQPVAASRPTAQIQCAGGCGFFGDEKTENMCSLCYRTKYFGPPKEKKDEKSKNDKSKPTAIPVKCTKGCGFFGAENYNGMCSKCYQLYPKERGRVLPGSEDKKKESSKVKARRRWKLSILKVTAFRRFLRGKRPEQKNKNRCWKCRRKIGISGIECRCGYIFCGKHRYANEHDCLFDHKQAQRKKIAKENQEVKGAKFEKIGEDD